VRLEKQQGKNKFKNYFVSFVPARMNPFGRARPDESVRTGFLRALSDLQEIGHNEHKESQSS